MYSFFAGASGGRPNARGPVGTRCKVGDSGRELRGECPGDCAVDWNGEFLWSGFIGVAPLPGGKFGL